MKDWRWLRSRATTCANVLGGGALSDQRACLTVQARRVGIRLVMTETEFPNLHLCGDIGCAFRWWCVTGCSTSCPLFATSTEEPSVAATRYVISPAAGPRSSRRPAHISHGLDRGPWQFTLKVHLQLWPWTSLPTAASSPQRHPAFPNTRARNRRPSSISMNALI